MIWLLWDQIASIWAFAAFLQIADMEGTWGMVFWDEGILPTEGDCPAPYVERWGQP